MLFGSFQHSIHMHPLFPLHKFTGIPTKLHGYSLRSSLANISSFHGFLFARKSEVQASLDNFSFINILSLQFVTRSSVIWPSGPARTLSMCFLIISHDCLRVDTPRKNFFPSNHSGGRVCSDIHFNVRLLTIGRE